MSSVYDLEVEDGVFEDVASPSVALVPVTPTAYCAPRPAVTRPDASFVTQLIATAEQLPQTCHLRRAAPADALSAYRAFEHRIKDARVSTRQVA
jgi:hypothetical protein